MKNIFLLLFILCNLTGCESNTVTHKETVIKYYNARSTGNYNQIKSTIGDTITIVAGDYVMPYNHSTFYEQFKWDSIFKPSYKIIALEESSDQITALVTQDCIRNDFLKNNPLKCFYKISFSSGKISKIEDVSCEDVDWNAWQQERDSLVNWIKKTHPELDGFINDMTMSGSIKYLKAIELYKAHQKILK